MSNLVNIIQNYGVENLGRFYSVYRGVVINRSDKDNAGKIEVNIPGIQDGVNVIARPRNFHGTIDSGSKSLTPRVGEIVYVEFERGDPFKALWSLHPASDQEGMPEDLDEDTIGIVTPSGNKILLKEKDGNLIVELLGDCIINSKKQVIINGGENRGVVNIATIESLVKALTKDLVSVSSGQNLSTWMATDLPKMEDTKFIH